MPPASMIAFIGNQRCYHGRDSPHMNLPNSLIGHADLPRAAARGGAAHEVRRAADPRRAEGTRRRGDLRRWRRSPTGSTAIWRGAAKQVTALGQFIDPLADKLLTSAAFISLVQMDLAPAWMVAIIIGREFAVTALRSLAYARGVAMPASPLGKIKMVAQVVAILALILGKDHLHGLRRDRAGRAVGGGAGRARVGGRLLPAVREIPQSRG